MNKLNDIAEFGGKLMLASDIDVALPLISAEAKSLVNAQRCSIFIVDREDNMLWTKFSDGIGRIVISVDSGIIGDTYKTKEAQLVNNPYDDSRFLQAVDKKSGFTTKNMITVPIFDSGREILGILQVLNKERGDFDSEDLSRLIFFANYVSGSIELVLMNEKS